MKIIEVSKDSKEEWDEYISSHPHSTFYHQFGWRDVVEETYGHKPIYLAAIENDKIVGVFPIFLMKNLIFGKRLISIPFSSYGGPLANNDYTYKHLIKKGKEIATETNSKFLEIRANPNIEQPFQEDFDKPSHGFVTFIMDLSMGKENIWKNMNKKRRNAIRNSRKNGLSIVDDHTSLENFYDIYSRNVKRLGTPVHSKKFFRNIMRHFVKGYKIFNVKKESVVIASSFLLLFKKEVISGWAGALDEYLHYNPNDFMYWKIIEHFCDSGFERFDFGRATIGTGVYNFKKKWKANEINLDYMYYQIKGQIPDYDLSKSSTSGFIYLWQKLPLSITKIVGPKIRKHIP